jgi:hypothetical protein
MPLTVKYLKLLADLEVPKVSAECMFDREDLRRLCGGHMTSNGFCVTQGAFGTRAYKLLESTHDPLLPSHLGAHGAQISCYGKGKNVSLDFYFTGILLQPDLYLYNSLRGHLISYELMIDIIQSPSASKPRNIDSTTSMHWGYI